MCVADIGAGQSYRGATLGRQSLHKPVLWYPQPDQRHTGVEGGVKLRCSLKHGGDGAGEEEGEEGWRYRYFSPTEEREEQTCIN